MCPRYGRETRGPYASAMAYKPVIGFVGQYCAGELALLGMYRVCVRTRAAFLANRLYSSRTSGFEPSVDVAVAAVRGARAEYHSHRLHRRSVLSLVAS